MDNWSPLADTGVRSRCATHWPHPPTVTVAPVGRFQGRGNTVCHVATYSGTITLRASGLCGGLAGVFPVVTPSCGDPAKAPNAGIRVVSPACLPRARHVLPGSPWGTWCSGAIEKEHLSGGTSRPRPAPPILIPLTHPTHVRIPPFLPRTHTHVRTQTLTRTRTHPPRSHTSVLGRLRVRSSRELCPRWWVKWLQLLLRPADRGGAITDHASLNNTTQSCSHRLPP